MGLHVADMNAREWLDREDLVCGRDREARLEWLTQMMPKLEYVAFPGAHLSKFLFEEARYCFIYGQFIASIMLGAAYIEQTLAALLYAAGRSDLERANAVTLLREAVALGWIDQAEFEGFDNARALRNPVSHFRKPLHEETVEYRSVVNNEMPYSVLEEDARTILRVVFKLMSRRTPL